MAKKSAMSKGYRKTIKKKPFLTKNEIIALIVIVVAIIAGMIIVDMVSKAGTISANEVQNGDIIGFASTEMRNRYVKLGTVNELEGYVREGGPTVDAPTTNHSYTPVDENDPMSYFNVSSTVYEASEAADTIMGYYSSAGMDHISEKYETTVYGLPAYVYSANASYYDETLETEAAAEETTDVAETEAAETEVAAEETTEEAAETEVVAEETTEEAAVTEEPAPNTFTQSISMYVYADEDHSISIHAYLDGEDDSFYIPDEEIVDYMQKLSGAITPLNAVEAE